MVGTDRDDELARTATAPGSAPETLRPADPVGSTLGRYRLERELGSGGMGVVHAAFDPDLERRVALKVLREAAGSSDARQRLLREARAMARLAHPNVVAVHEVSSANGRDYVAMELIDGQTLAEWMRAEPRPENQIIDAFVQAGRGLAAAHAAGIVHRDFKPHNILRHPSGRIVVTDFGLAREAMEAAADPLAETRELRVPAASTAVATTQSSLSGLTQTGSVLGTPAYMAPEQWSGGAVTPATDQFAFCVALWEALAGERPFRGPTIEKLREEVTAGPAKLDASKIPRRLRAALVRGLDPDPARRWRSMDELLAGMQRVGRTSALVWILSGAAICAGGLVLLLALQRDDAPAAAPACRAPLLVADTVWPDGAAAKLRAGGQRPTADLIDADVRAWKQQYTAGCALPDPKREPVLSCLDGVLARIDVLARAVEPLAGKRAVDVGPWLVDPAVCAIEPPPRLIASLTPQMKKTVAALMREQSIPGDTTPETAKQMIADAQGDACASVYARYTAITISNPQEREGLLAEVAEEAERCNDERVRAEIALMTAELALESSSLGPMITSKVKLADLAAKHVMQEDVQGALDGMLCEVARRADQLDEAITRAESAMKHYELRGRTTAWVDMGIKLADLKGARATLEDLGGMQKSLEDLRARAVAKLGEDSESVRDVDAQLGSWKWNNGDVAGAVASVDKLWRPEPNQQSRKITGKVVDGKGAPVANAKVVAAKRMGGNALTMVLASLPSTRIAKTTADGTFEIPDAVEFGVIVAEANGLRAWPQKIADTVTLRLEPTTTIQGRVDLHGEPPQLVTAIAADPDHPDVRYGWPSPVAADGSFEIGGVPLKKLKVFSAITRNHTRQGPSVDLVVKGPVANLALQVPTSKRVLHVVVRSSVGISVGNAEVIVMPGKVPSMTARELRQKVNGIDERQARQVEGEHAPPPVVKLAHPGDMFATMTDVPEGAATACAIALPPDLADPKLGKKIDANLEKLKIECVPVPDGAEAVVIEVPPFPRID